MTASRVNAGELNRLINLLNANGITLHRATRGQISTLFGVSDRRARSLQDHLRKNYRGDNEEYLSKRPEIAAVREEVEALKQEAKEAAKVYPPIKREGKKTGYMAELHVPDLHVGKYCWGSETLGDNYDTNLAISTFEAAVDALLSRAGEYTFDQILLVVGSDMLHTDNLEGTTSAGTPQDTDTRYQRSFKAARQMLTRTIERLRQIACVKVVIVPGNHDTLSSWHMGDSLECYFHKAADVEVDNAPAYRKYVQWGKVMLMFTHGNNGKLADYPLNMAVEQPRMWADTVFREAHSGDKHQFSLQEFKGVLVRISPALCPPDAWHSKNFYIGNQRAAEMYVWHNQDGLVCQARYTVPKHLDN